MFDIVSNNPAVLKRCKKLGITPLIIGKDVELVKNSKEQKHAAALIVLATTNDRGLLEGPVDGVVDIEDEPKKDHMHYRRGGLDQVNGRILSSQKKAYVIAYSSVREDNNPAVKIGRILANAAIAKKAGVPVILTSFADKPENLPKTQDLEAFWRAMGLDDALSRKQQKEFSSWIARAKHRASDKYIAEGVRKA